MKIAIGSVFVLVALLWTVGAAFLAQLVQWSSQGLAAGAETSLGTVVAAVSMPSWLTSWIDASAWSAAPQVLAGTLTRLSGALPFIGDVVAWLAPAVWVIWGLGMLALAGLTALGMTLLRHLERGFGSAAQAA